MSNLGTDLRNTEEAMSNGNFKYAYTADEKAALLDQFGKVMQAITEGHRPAQYISDGLQAIIGNDVIKRRQRVITSKRGVKTFLVVSDHKRIRDAIDAGKYENYTGTGNSWDTLFPVHPVDQYVRLEYVPPQPSMADIMNRYDLVDPITALAFGETFPEEQLRFDGGRPSRLCTLWRDPNGYEVWSIVLDSKLSEGVFYRVVDIVRRPMSSAFIHGVSVIVRTLALVDET
jgi:hypothetical protein